MADSRRPRSDLREAGESRRSRWDRSSKEGSRWDRSSSQRSDRSYKDRSPERSYRDRSPADESRYQNRLSGHKTSNRDSEYRSDRQRIRELTEDIEERQREARRSSEKVSQNEEPSQTNPTDDPIERMFREYERGMMVKPAAAAADPASVSYGIPQLAAYNDVDDRRKDSGDEDLDGKPLPEAEPTPKFTGFGMFSKKDVAGTSTEVPVPPKKPMAPIKMSLGVQKPKAPPALKKTAAVASIFGEDDDSEEEEMPAAAKMRMRNIGRETPTAAGPNSFGKGRLGFCDRQKIIAREIQKKIEDV